jgi:ubiquinone biosynthesis accessory factor UbiK
MDRFGIDDIVKRLVDNVPPAFRSLQTDLEANFRAVLRGTLARLDLVTRDEFEAQKKVLERAHAQIAALEARIAALESSPGPSETV